MDWDNDGHLDILSGCYWSDEADAGYILILRGDGTLNFAAAEPIKNQDGIPIQNVADKEDKDSLKNICTHQHAVDYEGDGDLDLVVGCFGTNFYLHEHQTDGEVSGLNPNSQELGVKSPSYHTAPHLVDWDRDGDLDLLTGSADGGALISHNTGTREKPVWSEFQQLIPPSSAREQFASSSEDDVRPAPATRIWATDWNHDGELDLLVGDCVTLVRPAEGVHREEYDRRRKEFDQELAEMSKRHSESDTNRRYEEAMTKAQADGTEVDAELTAEYEGMQEEVRELWESKGEFEASTMTGFVWLYLRQPVEQVAAAREP